MGKLRKQRCRHCSQGEVFIDHDVYGWYESCLQCGYSRDLPDLVQPVAKNLEKKEVERLPEKRTGRYP